MRQRLSLRLSLEGLGMLLNQSINHVFLEWSK